EVYAMGTVLVDETIGEAGDIDTAIVNLKFENGCLGVIDNSRQAVYGYDQRLEIFGSKGKSKMLNTYVDTETLFDATGRHASLLPNFFMDRYTEAYYRELIAFIDAIADNKEVPVSAEDAMAATRIALAANESMLKKAPVSI
ncbi:MAG: Gfo/Idh/MocA family oxidoreductase, partial [Bacteroidota bacterium]